MTAARLPGSGGGPVTSTDVLAWLDVWCHAPAMDRLMALFGWPPLAADPRAALVRLQEHAGGWDFRGDAERHRLGEQGIVHDGEFMEEEAVVSAAEGLGLTGGMPVDGRFTHVVVLGGMVRACLNRARHAVGFVASSNPASVALLTAHRLIEGREFEDVRELGWAEVRLESAAALRAMRETFGIDGPPDQADRSPGAVPVDSDRDAEGRRRRAWFDESWSGRPEVRVLAAPSAAPDQRRTNTPDQLAFWADRVGIGPTDRLLLVTTEHYVPYQQLQAARVLGLPYRCAVVTTGTPWRPAGGRRGAGLLQELRSTARAAAALLQATDEEAVRPPAR